MQYVPELPTNHKLHVLQRYFEFCSEIHSPEMDASKTLSVIMAGIVPPIPDSEKEEARSAHAKWKRVSLEILAQMETELLKIAQEQNYTHVETLNTCETTKVSNIQFECCPLTVYCHPKNKRSAMFLQSNNCCLSEKHRS